jgi:hypothetical protein
VTGGTCAGPPGAFFLQTVLWPTEGGRIASIGCCASTGRRCRRPLSSIAITPKRRATPYRNR